MNSNNASGLNSDPFHLLIEVGGTWRGLHVENQSGGDNARLIRHTGVGNRCKLVPSGAVADGHNLLVEVGEEWKGTHVQNQSSADGARLIRHSGAGNTVRLVDRGNGTHNFLVQAGDDTTSWKGLHVDQQNNSNGASLIRHSGDGNALLLMTPDLNDHPDASVEYHLLVLVDGIWKGVHVLNQSTSNGAGLIRHSGLGNAFRFTPTSAVFSGYHISVDVGGQSTGVHVHNQSSADGADLIRHVGDGNVFRLVHKDDGTYRLLVAVGHNLNDWKGVHVQSQSDSDGARLIRHSGDGNAFLLVGKHTAVLPAVDPHIHPDPDDLSAVEGIGPKINGLLQEGGIRTFRQLAHTPIEVIQAILTAAGPRYALANPGTWPEQAALLADGKTEELAALQARLVAGRPPATEG